jgi:lipopolysaccharide transport protein LptA
MEKATMNLKQLPEFLILAIVIGTQMAASAAESGQATPVSWNHDGEFRVSIEGELRIVNMKDNVIVVQGEIEVRGDEARFEYTLDTDELLRVTVTGTPVSYQQNGESSEEAVSGTSDTLIMYNDESSQETIVELVGNAFLETPDSTMRCARIVHQTELDLVSGTGPCQGSLSSTTN